MAFFSWQFITFLTISVVVYYLIPGRFQWLVLLASSAWYYMVGGGPRAAVFVAVTVVTTWGGAVLMDGISSGEESRFRKSQNLGAEKLSRDQKRILKAAVQKKKRRIMVLVVLLNVGILGDVK